MSTLDPTDHARLAFLARVVARERSHLESTDRRLFAHPLQPDTLEALVKDPRAAESLDAFVARFGRLQDTLGDKLLPALLRALGEHTGTVVDNLDRAERLGWLSSSDDWLTARKLRNRMIHEYVEDPVALADALNAGHELVPLLAELETAMRGQLKARFGIQASVG